MINSILKLLALLLQYLDILTFVLVIFPSLSTICLRFALYKHLVYLEKRVRRLINRGERGKQPEIIEELERRFKEASSNLEQVNTAALIDQVYSREKVLFFSCEQIDYLCRTLPNLLIAFGLLGTFIGITVSLTSLSQAITQNNTSNISILISGLQQPLKGMGIAFTTSLIGIFFSALLTVVNLIINTNVVKLKLISTIEDYLDNIYLAKIQRNNRLDEAVERLVKEFTSFLGRFGTTVRDAVESSLGAKIQQIVDVNKQATDLARQVYSGFQESSGTIANSASEFKYAISTFENAVAAMIANTEKYQQVAQTFENSQFPEKLSQATNSLANVHTNFAQSTLSLANTVKSIEMAVIEVKNSSHQNIKVVEEISRINQTSLQVLEVQQSNQQSLGEIIPQLKQGAQSFQLAVTKLDSLEKRIAAKPDSWSDTQVELTKLVGTLKNYTEEVNLGMHTLHNSTKQVNLELQTLGDRFLESIGTQTKDSKHHLLTIEEKIQHCAKHLNDTKHENSKLIRVIEMYLNKNESNPSILDRMLKLINK